MSRNRVEGVHRAFGPRVERLESKIALSGATGLASRLADAPAVSTEVHAQATSGTIQGRVTNDANTRGVAGVRVQLVNAEGAVVKTAVTSGNGAYRFRVPEDGAYVVRLVTPRRFTQTSPTFSTAEPTGAYATNPATGKPYTGANWNYHTGNNNPANGPVGPASWATVAPAGELPFESPINITGAPVDLSQHLTINYQNATPKAIINNGAQIQVQFPSPGVDTLTLDGEAYNLSQFHYHDPSENQVNGVTYPMEEHFVNLSASGAETVVAVFLQLGAHNSALQPILDAATAHLTAANSTTTLSTAIDFSGLLPTSRMGWFYEGSLTTPPLSQVVNWLVLSTPITLDYAQLQQYEAVASGAGFLPNARAIQPLDGRQVNQFGFDVNFQGDSVQGLDFSIARNGSTTASVASAHGQHPGFARTQSLIASAHRANVVSQADPSGDI